MHMHIHIQYTTHYIFMHTCTKCSNIHVQIQFKPRALSVFVSSVIYIQTKWYRNKEAWQGTLLCYPQITFTY